MLVYIAGVIVAGVLLYLYGTRNFDYWTKRGVKHEKPVPFIGSMWGLATFQASLSDCFERVYWMFKDEKIAGMFMGNKPTVVIRDPELIKQVLVADSSNFHARGLISNKVSIEPLSKNLFFADGDLWKLLRHRITPAFTTSKLKAMFPLIIERAERLKQITSDMASQGQEVNARELMARYTTEFIGAVGFGIDANCLKDEDSEFRKLGKRIFTLTFRDRFMAALQMAIPWITKYVDILDPMLEKGILGLVQGVMKERNYKPSSRNDFIDMLMIMKDQGTIVGESIEKVNPDGTAPKVELEIDDLLLAAQVFVFFAAGFETSSSTSSYALHQLALHPEIQEKCQREIDEVLSRYDGKLCYEAVNEMKYLAMCFNEGMRIFPSVGFLIRESARSYTFPGTGVTIDKGVGVVVSLQGLQTDEKYFENPLEFRPERFSSESVKDMPKHVFMPFGTGSRACIGERMGLMQSIAGLASILSEFSVAPSKNTLKVPIKTKASFVAQGVVGGLPLAFTPRKKVL